MRWNIRIKINNLTFFVMLAQTQTLEGVSSLQKDGKHIVMWDLENCDLQQAETTLKKVQTKYRLSNIYLVSDTAKSYRAWCYSRVSFDVFLKILYDSLSILDFNFFFYTIKRKKATLRTGSKKGRSPQKIVSVLESYYLPINPSKVEKVTYDTGLEKQGKSLLLGGE
jgi:hypothetical protein